MLKVPSKAKELIANRLKRLEQDLSPLAAQIENKPLFYNNKQRLSDANVFYQEAIKLFGDSHLFDYRSWRKQIYKAILHAQVEIDTINNPEVDPVNGWVKQEYADLDYDGLKEIHIDTQLMNLIFKPELSGALVDFEYKPRKTNLVNYSPEYEAALNYVDYFFEKDFNSLSIPEIKELVGQQAKATIAIPTDYLKTKYSKDLAGFRLIKELKSNSLNSVKIIKHFNFKAGIGGHLPNCTTGFSTEYWLESASEINDNLLLANQFSFLFPSASEQGMFLRPLSVFGGIAEKAIDASKEQLIPYTSVEGGLYGIRIIDGLSNLIMDIRSAKPLSGALVYPLFDANSNLQSMVLLFFIKAKTVFTDEKANMIFLSIM